MTATDDGPADERSDEAATVDAGAATALLELVEMVNDHDTRLVALETATTPAAPTLDGDDPDEDTAFGEWANWLRATYCLQAEIPDAWADVPSVVAELRALYVAHQGAQDSEAGAMDQVYWHDALDRVVARIDRHVVRVRTFERRELRDAARPATL